MPITVFILMYTVHGKTVKRLVKNKTQSSFSIKIKKEKYTCKIYV